MGLAEVAKPKPKQLSLDAGVNELSDDKFTCPSNSVTHSLQYICTRAL